MDEIIKSIRAYLYEKTTSPLLGSFIAAWVIWNYRIVMTIFSEQPLATKFSTIDKLFQDNVISIGGISFDLSGHILNGATVPTIVTLFYIYGYPYLAKPVYEHSLSKQIELRKIKQQEENNRMLSEKESRELNLRLAKLQEEFDNETEGYRKQISDLTKIIEELEKVPNVISDSENKSKSVDDLLEDGIEKLRKRIQLGVGGDFQLSDLYEKYDWDQLSAKEKQELGKRFKSLAVNGELKNVLVKGRDSGNKAVYTLNKPDELSSDAARLLAQFVGLPENGGFTAKTIANRFNWHIDKTRAILEDLAQKYYLIKAGASAGQQVYSLSHAGRKYLLDNQLIK